MCFRIVTARAQSLPQPSTYLTTTTGLPNNSVTGVEQDRAGFIWIATDDGLARYDGRAVKVFRHRPGDTTSLAENRISQFEQTPTGSFLITTESGSFQLFDPAREQFTTVLDEQLLARHETRMTKGHLSADGQHFWGLVPGRWLIHYDLRRKTTQFFDVARLTGQTNFPYNFILTPTGYLYAQCGAGLFQLHTRTGKSRLIPYPFKSPPGNYWPIDYQPVVQAPNGEIAVFGYRVIALYNPVQDRFHTIPIPDLTDQRDIWYQLKTLADNRLYLGYDSRLYRLNAADTFTRIDLPSPITKQTSPWLLDRSGVLWVGGRLVGLARIDRQAQPFGFVPKHKSFSKDLLEQDLGVSLPDYYAVWDIDHWPRYALGPNHRGYLIDSEHIFQHIPGRNTLAELTALRMNDERACCKLCLKVSRRGRVWFYSNDWGLIGADPDGKTKRLYPNSRLPLIASTPSHDAADIQPIGQSVWVGSQYGFGLFRYDLIRNRFDPPIVHNPKSVNSLPINTINCLSADPTDSTVLWIGTPGGGLCRLDTRTMAFRRVGEPEGFPNGTILSMETDDQGMLWCATNRGLVRVNPKTLAWRHFTTEDGLTEEAFLQTSSAHLPDGRLVFGTPNGRIIFNPAAIRDKDYEPPLVLTSLLVNNKPLEANRPDLADRRTALPMPINALPELVLDHTQNFLTLTFAALDYGKADKLTYRYKLEGVDADWVQVGHQNSANYTQLAPGRYRFSVNSTTADGRWSRQVKQLRLVITPPFWATWWAYVLYALALGGLILGFVRFRIRQARQQQEIELKRREAEQLRVVDQLKTRFFTNITHEFRTPLTLILSPAESLLADLNATPYAKRLTSIRHNAYQLLSLINQLLDLSRLDAQLMPVDESAGRPDEAVAALVQSFLPLAQAKQIQLTYSTNAQDTYWFDHAKLERIVSNLLSNAIKFTSGDAHQPGQVDLTLWEKPEGIRLTVSDTGIGIPTDRLVSVFNRFYQVDDSSTRQQEGTGIGLALVKELVELQQGRIDVMRIDEPGQSWKTRFTVWLPYRRADNSASPASAGRVTELDLPSPAISVGENVNGTSAPEPGEAAAEAPVLLLVEDNTELAEFIIDRLPRHFRVHRAVNGQVGFDLAVEQLPDLIISDVLMPVMNGYDLCRQLKSDFRTSHIPVILLTAKAALHDRIEGLELGADDYLTKPFHLPELQLRIHNQLEQRRRLRSWLRRQLTEADPGQPTPAPADPFLEKVYNVLAERLADSAFGVDELADQLAMSRHTLNRKVKALVGLSTREVLRAYRLKQAIPYLQQGYNTSETAYRVGFDSPAYFIKCFREQYGVPPQAFLRQAGQ